MTKFSPIGREAAPAASGSELQQASDTSALWGRKGELWSPAGRLPDFSFAGYRSGQEPPVCPIGVSVREFGAKGDGTTDDTEAFLQALAAARGAVEVPPGRYVITKILEINRSGVVLRGAGPEKSVLVCPKSLTDIKPDWSATTSGRPTSQYSWLGGIVWLRGSVETPPIAAITGSASRGEKSFEVAATLGLKAGQRIMVTEVDTPENTLAVHLYAGDAGKIDNLLGSATARLVCRIEKIAENRVWIDRPLRFDLRPEWTPKVCEFRPSVSDSGVESLGFEFPVQRYEGHFTELGFNALAMNGVSDCWARDLRIAHADSGIFVTGYFCDVQGVTFVSARETDPRNRTGHHGVYFQGDDNLFRNFDFQTRFIHDISVSRCAGNVFADGKGVDLCFDHHVRAPYENLFTNLDAGEGTRPWASGGGTGLGKHCAARGTFWNIRARQAIPAPPESFSPRLINVVGVTTDQPSLLDPDGLWFETFPKSGVVPENLHQAQLSLRREKDPH